MAILGKRPAGSVVRYPSVALAALATSDLGQARDFVGRTLGPLATGDETPLRLMETLRAFLDEGARHRRAAERLGVHENTVRYRVRQAEDLFERPVRPDDLDLRVALALAEMGVADFR